MPYMPKVIPAAAVTAPRNPPSANNGNGTKAAAPRRLRCTRSPREPRTRLQGRPAGRNVAMGLDRRQRQRPERQRAAPLRRPVEVPLVRIGGLGEGERRQSQGRRGDGDHDQKDAPPAEPANQSAPQRRADRQGDAVAAGPDAERPASLDRVGPHDANDRQRGRQQEGGAEAGERAACEQRRQRRGGGAQKRAAGEDGDSRHEDPPPTQEVGEQPAGQQEGGVNQVIAVDDPLQRAQACRRNPGRSV